MTNRYLIKITGKHPKEFIKRVIQEKVNLYDVDFSKNSSMILVDEDGYQKILAMKTSYEICLIDEFGKVKYLHLLERYRFFFFLLVLGLLLLVFLSSLTFDISIEHPKSEIRELVRKDLEEFGIRKYHFQVSYQKKEEIIKKILKKEKERLEWMEIDRVGTKYVVSVEERIKNNTKKEVGERNIIAKKNAMIVQIYAENGEVRAKKNQYVQKGDVLISGFISKDEKVVKKERAEGYVFGEVWYRVTVEVPKVYEEEIKTGRKKRRIEFRFFDQSLFLFQISSYPSFHVDRTPLLKNKIFPIGIYDSMIYETHETKKDYSSKKGEQEAISLAEKKLVAKLGKKDEVISKKVLKKREKDSKIELQVFFKVKEDITDYESIKDIKIEELEGGEDETSN